MPSDTGDVLARAAGVLERHGERQALQMRVRERRRRSAGRRLIRMAMAVAVIAFAAAATGLAGVPLGITGVLVALLAMVVAVGALAVFPRSPMPRADALPAVALAQLPARTEDWLAAQRPRLPAPAIHLVDTIALKLDALAPQLATLDEREPAAGAVRRLLADELPELVGGYTRVPQALRSVDTDGIVPERRLVEGLEAVDGALTRMSEDLARGDLERLATQGEYLRLKYRGEPIGG